MTVQPGDAELYRLQHEVMDRFDAQPFATWPKPLLQEVIRVFDLAGITPAVTQTSRPVRCLQVVR